MALNVSMGTFLPNFIWASHIAYKTFKEWNPDPEIAGAAEKLYGDIDHLELYVGLQAEDAKPVIEGAGLCPGTPRSVRVFEPYWCIW